MIKYFGIESGFLKLSTDKELTFKARKGVWSAFVNAYNLIAVCENTRYNKDVTKFIHDVRVDGNIIVGDCVGFNEDVTKSLRESCDIVYEKRTQLSAMLANKKITCEEFDANKKVLERHLIEIASEVTTAEFEYQPGMNRVEILYDANTNEAVKISFKRNCELK